MKQRAAALMESKGLFGLRKDHGTKSVLTVKNNHLECCPIHGSVAFHPFHLNWARILQSATGKKDKRREKRVIDRRKNREKREGKGKRGLREIRAYPKTDIQLNVNCNTLPLCAAK